MLKYCSEHLKKNIFNIITVDFVGPLKQATSRQFLRCKIITTKLKTIQKYDLINYITSMIMRMKEIIYWGNVNDKPPTKKNYRLGKITVLVLFVSVTNDKYTINITNIYQNSVST